jgi:hypothetical protein
LSEIKIKVFLEHNGPSKQNKNQEGYELTKTVFFL